MLEKIVKLKKSKEYLIGWYRYYAYYSKDLLGFNVRWLIRKHIQEQYKTRLNSIYVVCKAEGSCIKCGCQVPALQFANKACKGLCYPYMMNKETWGYFKKGNVICREGHIWAYKEDVNEFERA